MQTNKELMIKYVRNYNINYQRGLISRAEWMIKVVDCLEGYDLEAANEILDAADLGVE